MPSMAGYLRLPFPQAVETVAHLIACQQDRGAQPVENVADAPPRVSQTLARGRRPTSCVPMQLLESLIDMTRCDWVSRTVHVAAD